MSNGFLEWARKVKAHADQYGLTVDMFVIPRCDEVAIMNEMITTNVSDKDWKVNKNGDHDLLLGIPLKYSDKMKSGRPLVRFGCNGKHGRDEGPVTPKGRTGS